MRINEFCGWLRGLLWNFQKVIDYDRPKGMSTKHCDYNNAEDDACWSISMCNNDNSFSEI